MLLRLYNYLIVLAGHKYSLSVLAMVAFVESSIFLSFTSLLNFFYEGKNQLNKKIVKAGFTSLRKVKFLRDVFIKQAMGRINLTD